MTDWIHPDLSRDAISASPLDGLVLLLTSDATT
jgi:hypothetical protein